MPTGGLRNLSGTKSTNSKKYKPADLLSASLINQKKNVNSNIFAWKRVFCQ